MGSAVFVTDVDGVFTAPPTEPGAQLVKEILVDPQTGELELTGVSMDCAAHDVTGGLRAKLESAAEVLMQAPTVDAVYIVRLEAKGPCKRCRAKRLRSELPCAAGMQSVPRAKTETAAVSCRPWWKGVEKHTEEAFYCLCSV